jgi:hypothetical protein
MSGTVDDPGSLPAREGEGGDDEGEPQGGDKPGYGTIHGLLLTVDGT